MENKEKLDCTLVFVVNQQTVPFINPFLLLEKGIISKELMSSTQFNVTVAGPSYENADISVSQNLNKVAVFLKSDKVKEKAFVNKVVNGLKEIFKDFVAIGVNFSCQLPISVSEKIYKNSSLFEKMHATESDAFGFNILSSKDGYDQNLSCTPNKAKKCVTLVINNHFQKQGKEETFDVQCVSKMFTKLQKEFFSVRDSLSEEK